MWDWRGKMGEKEMRELLTGWVCVGGYRMDQQTAGDSGTPACTPRPFEGSEDGDELKKPKNFMFRFLILSHLFSM